MKKEIILKEAQRLENKYGFTSQLEKVFFLVEDYEITGEDSYLLQALEILSDYDYSAKRI